MQEVASAHWSDFAGGKHSGQRDRSEKLLHQVGVVVAVDSGVLVGPDVVAEVGGSCGLPASSGSSPSPPHAANDSTAMTATQLLPDMS